MRSRVGVAASSAENPRVGVALRVGRCDTLWSRLHAHLDVDVDVARVRREHPRVDAEIGPFAHVDGPIARVDGAHAPARRANADVMRVG